MMLYLSQLRLSRSPSVQALAALIAPEDASRRRSATHNLLWSVFADSPDRCRDFLWREDSAGTFLTLSARAPVQSDLFEPHQIKPFDPTLAKGDVLDFTLRANATKMKRGGKRADVVMDALHSLPEGTRAKERMAIAQQEGEAWLRRQGEKAGFMLHSAMCSHYAVEALPDYRGPRKGQPQFGILDLSGKLEVTDPASFISQLAAGFGRAKAFGCGLMLIRRSA